MRAVESQLAGTVHPSPQWKAVFDKKRLMAALQTARPALLSGLRLWASVCLALYVAYWLELDNPDWAGISAGIVCQPQLGASLRKGWFRMIGTLIGGVMIVLMTACFPQDRALFLLNLTLWCSVCAFCATILHNYASYSAAMAGITAVIIASDQLGAIGGLNGQAFMLAISRVTEICIGNLSAGIVLIGTDLGGARRQLATLLAGFTAAMMADFAKTLSLAGPDLPDTRPVRREYIRRVVALDPVIDVTLGESSRLRYHSPVLRNAVDGLFTALSGWRAIANRLTQLSGREAKAEATVVLRHIPPELLSLLEQADPARWTDDPTALRGSCETVVRRLMALPTGSPSQRLIADKAAETFMGISDALNGLALLVADPGRPVPRPQGAFHLRVADWLPALVNAGRAFVTTGAVALFWIITAFPSGAITMVWTAVPVLLFAPRADQVYAAAIRFTAGTIIATVCAAIMAFVVLPNLDTFAGFAMALGLYLIPAGALAAQPSQPVLFVAMSILFVPLLAPTNPITYDTVQFYNTTMAFNAGVCVAALSFRLVPPLSPALRTRRLLALTLRDLRHLAMGSTFGDWVGHMRGRLSAMPAVAALLQYAQILAALSLGTEILRLRPVVRRFGLGGQFACALNAVAQGRSALALACLTRLDEALADHAETEPAALRGRGSIIVIAGVLREHADYFDAGAGT